jgi:hypothetical protein
LIAVIKVITAAQGIAMTEGISKSQARGTTAPVPMWMTLRPEFFLLGPELTRYQR